MFKPILYQTETKSMKLYDFEIGHEGEVIMCNDESYFVKWYDNTDSDRVIKVSEGFYNKNNNKHGRHIYYYTNGAIKLDVFYKDGKKHGRETAYLNNGSLYYIKNYDAGVEHGEIILVDATNSVEKKLNVHYGVYHGMQQIYQYGKLIHTFEYENGIKHGIESRFSIEGKLLARWQWKNNMKNGNYNEYHPNGQLRFIAQYLNDLLHGTLIEFDITGKQIKRLAYLNGCEIAGFT